MRKYNTLISNSFVLKSLLLLLVALLTMSSHPQIVRMSHAAGYQVGTILSRYIVLVFALLFVLSLDIKKIGASLFIRRIFVLLGVLMVIAFTAFAIFNKSDMIGEVRAIGICSIAVMIGWMIKLDSREWMRILVVFSVLTVFVGLMQVFVNVGGFVIQEQLLTDNKNALGVMLASAAIVCFCLFLNCYSGKSYRWLYLAMCVIALIVLLTIRARAATLSFFMVAVPIIIMRHRNSDAILYLLLFVVVVTVIILLLPSGIKDYFYNSFFQGYEGGDVSSGRRERNAAGLAFLVNHFWTGGLGSKMALEQIHNYPLNKICSYGVLFVMPIIAIYLTYLIKALVCYAKSSFFDNSSIGYYVLMIPFIVSLAEPSLPFGPGTATVFNFIIFGFSLRCSSRKEFLQ